ncbi:hypothetical protein [Salmonella enterica]|nr:hypothetical protein [Salmonella enterica]
MPALRPAVRHLGPILQQLQHHIGRRPLVIFNADFETQILSNYPECCTD